MQHPALQTKLTESSFKAHIMDGDNIQCGMQAKLNDKPTTNTITIIKQTATTTHNDEVVLLPPTQMAHDLNEPKNSEKINNLSLEMTGTTTASTTKTTANNSGDGSGGDGDAIDCSIIIEKDNCHELISSINGLQENQTKAYEGSCEHTNSSSSSAPTCYKDGQYFLKLLHSEKSRLLSMADQAEHDMLVLTTNTDSNHEISDEIFGILRSVSGKTKLLVSQKFKQFEGLCHKNLNPTPDDKFPTTEEDLLGFWDMVNLQIEHIDSLFKDLELIKANNWQPTKDPTSPFVPTVSRVLKKSSLKQNNKSNNNNNKITTIPKASPNAVMMALKRDMQRKQLLEMKRRNKNAVADKSLVSSPIEIYVTENVS